MESVEIKKVLHITVHLGGGAGKAISGLCISSQKTFTNTVALLEKPQNMGYVESLSNADICVYVEPNSKILCELIKNTDIIVLSWWSHPLMVKLIQNFPHIPCRIIIWNHINGCNYPYLPAAFMEPFSEIWFTSKYSLCNPKWTNTEQLEIGAKANIIYGMGNFQPELIECKDNYIHGDNFIIGYVGTLNYAKINRNFIKYYKSIIEDIPNVKFLMLGEPSNDLLRDIHESGIEEYFELPGFVSDVGKYYKKMDVFAYLLEENNYATTENSLLEAMAYALPIIVLDNPIERNIIKHMESGYCVSDINDFKKRILELHDSNSAEKIGVSARKYVINEYRLSNMINTYTSSILRCSNTQKKIYDFISIIGKDPYDAFLFFAGEQAIVFKNIIENYNSSIKYDLSPIYFQENKSSIFQYEKYFSSNEKIVNLSKIIRSVYCIGE